MSEENETRNVRFGAFEVDFRAWELRKRGMRMKLQEKPFQILALLVERAGEVVTRKDLRERLWAPETHVTFDRSLNTAMNKLRRVLGDTAGNPRFVETLPRRGYRFLAPVTQAGGPAPRALKTRATIDSLAVLPFQNASSDPEMEYLSDGVSESLINALSQLPEMRVMARSTVFRYKGRELDPQTVGRELGVRAVLTGRVVQRGDTLVIAAELVQVDRGWRLWGERYRRPLSDIFEVQEEISQEISDKLRLHLTSEDNRRLAKRYTENTEAYRDYLRGRYCCNKMSEADLKKGIAYFEQAIRKDPKYALAYAGLADCYLLLTFFSLLPPKQAIPRASEAVIKALELDQELAEAHGVMGSIRKIHHWDWKGAEIEYERALELSPNYAAAHRWRAAHLSAMGRSEEALREIHKAQELDPLSLIISMEIAWNLYMARDYDGAVEQSLKTLEIEPNFVPAHHTLGLAYEQAGKYQEAISAFEKSRDGSESNPATLAALGHACALAGRKREAMKTLCELRKISERSYVPPYWPALVCAGLGDKDAGFEWLTQACEEHDVWLVWSKVDPRLDSLRPDSRFQDLLRRVGLAS